MSSFKKAQSFDQRKAAAKRMLEKYPDRVPVVIEKAQGSNAEDLPISKYMIPQDFTIAQFLSTLRKRINLSPDQAIFLYTENGIPPSSESMAQIYYNQVDSDGFLYMTYASESTFG